MAQQSNELNLTSIYFIAGNKLRNFLELLIVNSKNKEIAICKELTKKNELVFRGGIKNIIDKIINKEINLKGEFTLVVNGEKKEKKRLINNIIKIQTSKLLKKYTLTETVEIVHKISNISKKDIYKMALEIKNE